MGLVDSIVKVARAQHVKFGDKYYVPTDVSIIYVIVVSSAVVNICTDFLSVGT